MNLNINTWKPFKVSSILSVYNGKGITKEEIEENAGDFPVVQSGEENNGVLGKIDKAYCYQMNYTLTEKSCLTVARSGSAGFVSFQPDGCVVGDSAKILLLSSEIASTERYLFLRTVLMANKFKYAYGRKVTENKYMMDSIELPVCHNTDGSILIDEEHKYSEKGFVPDWEYMEDYIKNLRHKPLTTTNKKKPQQVINTTDWKSFILEKIFYVKYGVNLELNICEEVLEKDNTNVNFVSRTEDNNGVSSRVKLIDGIEPQKKGLITVAGGGSVLSTFLQDEPFYSGRDLYTLEAKTELSDAAKIFLITVIEKNKYKYSYGRQANKTLPYIELMLPVQHNLNGSILIDKSHQYSDEGFVPDWQFMENYIRSLPYGDRLNDS
ncbi:MAG: restriction endonuclease subunit S [Blautia sp.]|nr:restriction endonuclease subunit S [Blautia sp.]MCM1199976.1 restriction endonuclease subunit S [Bacteroides fragilis]